MKNSEMQNVTILGSTGSIGVSTLDVIGRHPEKYAVFALTAHKQVDKLFEQCLQFKPQFAVLGSAEAAGQLRQRLEMAGLTGTNVLHGESALSEVASDAGCQIVMAAIVGAAGLKPTLAAAKAGKKVLLANKEALVMSGQIFMDTIAASGSALLPIDSEHNAVFQCLPAEKRAYDPDFGVTKVLLTASGGPFLKRDVSTLESVTPEEAVAHPNWVMGRKISVDSATMMNKGLEVIEAHWLFGAPADQIEVVIHPQSVIHSMVSYSDGSVLAQLGNPDMRTPIAYGLGYPERIASGVAPLDLIKVGQLQFHEADFTRFPCLDLAYAALRTGGTAPAILNAANEVAVEAFLQRKIGFRDIDKLIASALDKVVSGSADTLESVLDADRRAREFTVSRIS